ncbi:MAG: CpaF family protein, partial [Nitratireductor sp.]|nr:CpaF family protein [Nitratireductor sp.]
MNRFSALHAASIEADIFGEEPVQPAAPPPAGQPPAAAPAPAAGETAAAPRPVAAVQAVPAQPRPAAPSGENGSPSRQKILDAKVALHRKMLEEFNLAALEKLPRDALVREIHNFVSAYVAKERLALNNVELEEFVGTLVDEMTGLGPLEPLMRNPDISDILINGPNNCYAEIKGVLQPIVIPFKDEAHLLRIVNKIVANVGRRIDEMNPMCDARMA